MGILKKLKDILFDEEEYTEQIKITPEMRNEETPAKVKEEKKVAPAPAPSAKEPVKMAEPRKEEVPIAHPERVEKPERLTRSAPAVEDNNANLSDRELYKSERTFPFVEFDEEKFEKKIDPMRVTSSVSLGKAAEPKRSTNVFEYERRKRIEKRTDYGKFEKIETTETIEKKKFKPSPIISPVYGILNKDYQKEDIRQKSDEKDHPIDIKEVRDKAFGEKKIPDKPREEKSNYYEEEKTVTLTPLAEKERKVKTIDELLEDTSDVIVDTSEDMDNEIGDVLPRLDKRRKSLKDIEEVHEDTKEMKMPDTDKEDNTLENDLFDLIDSMYDNKEDGE